MFHPKMQIHLLSSYNYTDGGLGEVFESTKHFWSFQETVLQPNPKQLK